ncbi:MAG: SRPBCC domain-containing protein [Ignavibacteriaceae bacterium]
MEKRKIITDKLVFEKTCRTIEDWFKVLDRQGGKKLSHVEIFQLISTIEGLKPLGQWNQNLLTTTYEWDRGLKERGQRDNGIEISISKTISVPVSELYNAWSDVKLRSKWLPEKNIVIRKATENKLLVITWKDDSTVRVELYKKGEDKSQAVVQQMKIPDSKTADKMKSYWSNALEKLKALLEK